MNKKWAYCLIAVFCISLLFSKEKAEQKTISKLKKEDVSAISESLGHLIGKNLKALGLKFDINLVVKGIKDSSLGKPAPLSEDDCVQAISLIQEQDFNEKANHNLKEANKFLEQNKHDKNTVALEDGRVQYKITNPGKGPAVQTYNSPLIRYTGKYLDGTVFSSTEEAEKISLEETIPGFNKGIIGMKEGEKRTLYIHPDLGYGKNSFLEPNSLLTFEVELIQVENSPEPLEKALTEDKDRFLSKSDPSKLDSKKP